MFALTYFGKHLITGLGETDELQKLTFSASKSSRTGQPLRSSIKKLTFIVTLVKCKFLSNGKSKFEKLITRGKLNNRN